MAVDKNKITAEATKFVQKGQWDKAIKAYERILAEDPKDVRVLLKVGELHQKKGDSAAAAETFNRVADAYSEQGFFLKAVAVFKQIAKLTPEDVRVNERLAALYQQLGLMSDAMQQLQLVAQYREKTGETAQLVEVFRSMVELDPENVASSIKLGELYAKENKAAQALELFRRAGEYLKKNKRNDEYLKVAERISFLAPDDHALSRELANLYLAKGDTKRALAKLQLCFKVDPKDIETLNLLAQAFQDLGQMSKTVSVFKELAQIYEQKGRREEAASTWKRIAALAPDDAEARDALGLSAPAAAAPPPPPPPAQPAPMASPVQPVRAAPPPMPMPIRAASADAIPRLLTETDVYMKYGLHDRALEHLQKVFAIEPDNAEGHDKARDIHLAAGNQENAVNEALLAARGWVTRNQPDRAQVALNKLRELSPSHPELGLLSAALGLSPPLATSPIAPSYSPPSTAMAEEVALTVVPEDEETTISDEPLISAEVVASTAADEALDAAAALDEDLEAVATEEIQVEPEPRPPVRAPAAGPPPGVRPFAAPPPPPRSPPPVPAPREPDLSDELEEADFFAQQGLVDEAREVLQGLLAAHPGHTEVSRRLEQLKRSAAPPPPPPAAPPPPNFAAPSPVFAAPPPSSSGGLDDTFDIARELAEELGGASAPASSTDDFQYSVDDVFSQFKKGVAETVNPEDSETHYDLGIAYKEMGLIDDAIHEFELALAGKSRKKEVDCLTMVGVCRRSKGENREAVQAFRRALQSDYLTQEAGRALHYELGMAHEALGETDVALWYYQKIAKVDLRYRDVKSLLERLGGGPGRAPAEEPNAATVSNGATTSPPIPRPGSKKNIGYV